MKIDRVIIQNFRSFNTRTPITKLGKINVFIGQIGSGKTNVIQALYMLKALKYHEYDNEVLKESVFDYLSNKKISIELEVGTSEKERKGILRQFLTMNPAVGYLSQEKNFLREIRYSVEIQAEKIVKEKLAISVKSTGTVDILERRLNDGNSVQCSIRLSEVLPKIDSSDKLRKMKLENDTDRWIPNLTILDSLSDKFENEIAMELKGFFGKFHWYNADRTIPNTITNGEDESLVGDGNNIKNHIRYLFKRDSDGLSSLKKIAKKFLGISDIKIDPSNNDVMIKKVSLNSWFDLSKLSAGEKQLLILLDAIVIQKTGNIYFIEEPEAHIHSKTQKLLLQTVFKTSKKSQFFITTHSPNFFKLDPVISNYWVKKNKGKSRIEKVDKESQIQTIKREMEIDNLDALKSNFVLFVEGLTELKALRKMGEILLYSVLKFIPIISYEGTGNIGHLRQFLNYARKLELIPLVIADGHDKNIKVLTGSNICYKLRDNNKEFEDQFENKIIVDAMKKIYNDNSCSFDNLEIKLQSEREEAKKVVDILEDYLGTVCKLKRVKKKRKLLKPEFGEALSGLIISDIARNPSREKTEFEKEIDEIMKWLK